MIDYQLIELPYKFEPRHYQRATARAYFLENKRRLIDVLHRRAGKSRGALNFIFAAALQRVGIYYHGFPELKQARRNIWDGIGKDGMRYMDSIPPRVIKSVNNSDLKLTLINGSIIQLVGMDRYDALMGSNPLGIVFDEYSLQHPGAWEYLSPILDENGGWAYFIYTPRGKNHGWDLLEAAKKNPEEWFVQQLGIDKTYNNDGTHILDERFIAKRRLEGYPEEYIQQEYFCSFDIGLIGAYYSKHVTKATEEGRICSLPIRTDYPVFTFWDIGKNDMTAIWFMQRYNGYLNFVHYYEDHDEGIEFYADYIRKFAKENKITYKGHFGPFDLEVSDFSVSGDKTRLQVAAEAGIDFEIVKKSGIEDGIQSVRTIFSRVRIDPEKCKQGLRCLNEYHKRWNTERKCYEEEPYHNWASHGADAFRYFAVKWHELYAQDFPSSIIRLDEYHP